MLNWLFGIKRKKAAAKKEGEEQDPEEVPRGLVDAHGADHACCAGAVEPALFPIPDPTDNAYARMWEGFGVVL